MVVTVVLFVAGPALAVLATLLFGLRPTRCSECGVLAVVSPASSPRRCGVCPGGLLAYPPSIWSGLFVRPAALRADGRRRR